MPRKAKSKGQKPALRRSEAEKIDRELAARAIQKRAENRLPNAAELAALRRWEKAQEEERRWQVYESIPKKHWQQMSGRQPKVLNEQATRYGIPFGGRTIDLPSVVRALHDFLADNARKLASDDGSANGRETPDQRRHRAASADLLELQVAERRGQLLPRDRAHEMLAQIAIILRAAGESLRRQFGREAHAVLTEALDDAEREIKRCFGNGQAEKTTTEA